MKIVEIETLRVTDFPNLTFVKIRTDDGITGLGETFYGADAVEAHIHSIASPALLGQDPLRREHHAAQLAGYTGYSGSGAETRARSAVDLALWDILGQASGQPLYNLLGGRTREAIDIYNTCAGRRYVNRAQGQAVANWGLAQGRYEDLYAAINHPGELARDLLQHGITGMKVWPFDTYAEASNGHYISDPDLADGLSRIAEIREAVGLDIEVMVELHALWDVPSARKIVNALAEFQPRWIEDPVRSDIPGGLARIASETSAPIAAGETITGLAAFQKLLAEHALGVVTVDTTWSGGLTTAQQVAALADSFGIPVAPHDCTGPVGLTACVHLATAAPNTLLQETVRAGYLDWYHELVEGGAIVQGGRVRAPEEPGLGIRLRPELDDHPGTTRRVSSLAGSAVLAGSGAAHR